MKKEVKFVGLGGQGILLASAILAKSASVLDGYFAVLTEKYTSDMRGGEVSSDVIISSERVTYPLVEKPDFLIVLSQDGYDKYSDQLKSGGTLMYDSDLVTPRQVGNIKVLSATFNRLAVNFFGNRAVMNMIMLGFVGKMMNFLSFESLEKIMINEIEARFLELNLKAFRKGGDLGKAEE